MKFTGLSTTCSKMHVSLVAIFVAAGLPATSGGLRSQMKSQRVKRIKNGLPFLGIGPNTAEELDMRHIRTYVAFAKRFPFARGASNSDEPTLLHQRAHSRHTRLRVAKASNTTKDERELISLAPGLNYWYTVAQRELCRLMKYAFGSQYCALSSEAGIRSGVKAAPESLLIISAILLILAFVIASYGCLNMEEDKSGRSQPDSMEVVQETPVNKTQPYRVPTQPYRVPETEVIQPQQSRNDQEREVRRGRQLNRDRGVQEKQDKQERQGRPLPVPPAVQAERWEVWPLDWETGPATGQGSSPGLRSAMPASGQASNQFQSLPLPPALNDPRTAMNVLSDDVSGTTLSEGSDDEDELSSAPLSSAPPSGRLGMMDHQSASSSVPPTFSSVGQQSPGFSPTLPKR